jgi:hypothetical protein
VAALEARQQNELAQLDSQLAVEHLSAVQAAQLEQRRRQAQLDAEDERAYCVRQFNDAFFFLVCLRDHALVRIYSILILPAFKTVSFFVLQV